MSRPAERLAVVLCWLAAMVPLAAMVVLLGFLLYQGWSSLTPGLFFGDTPPWQALTGRLPVWDGIWPACVGTLSVVTIAGALAIPLGIASGVYLSECASGTWKGVLSLAVDMLAGVPSILMGLFGFALILFLRQHWLPGAKTGLLLAGCCMALLILPYVVNTTNTALAGIPEPLRLIGPSLGLSRLQSIFHILLPEAARGILGGAVLAIGRAAEDTAVILLTGVVANAGLPRGLFDTFEALPFVLFTTAAEYQDQAQLQQGFGTALVLLVLTSLLFLAAHAMHHTLERRWRIRQ